MLTLLVCPVQIGISLIAGLSRLSARFDGNVAMRRWTMRILVVLGGFLIVATLSGATYQWLATRKELASTPPPGRSLTLEGTGYICGARARAPLR
jgi:hypothetical protein